MSESRDMKALQDTSYHRKFDFFCKSQMCLIRINQNRSEALTMELSSQKFSTERHDFS